MTVSSSESSLRAELAESSSLDTLGTNRAKGLFQADARTWESFSSALVLFLFVRPLVALVGGLGLASEKLLMLGCVPDTVAKKVADDRLRASKLPYTILRPGGLSNNPGSGKVSTIFSSSGAKERSCENLATCVLTALSRAPPRPGRVFDVVDGKQPIEDLFS